MLLKKNGTVQRLSAPYIPEKNGGSERKNRIIVEMARTLKSSNPDLKFPPSLVVNTSEYVLNRTGKSPIRSL